MAHEARLGRATLSSAPDQHSFYRGLFHLPESEELLLGTFDQLPFVHSRMIVPRNCLNRTALNSRCWAQIVHAHLSHNRLLRGVVPTKTDEFMSRRIMYSAVLPSIFWTLSFVVLIILCDSFCRYAFSPKHHSYQPPEFLWRSCYVLVTWLGLNLVHSLVLFLPCYYSRNIICCLVLFPAPRRVGGALFSVPWFCEPGVAMNLSSPRFMPALNWYSCWRRC